MAGDGPYRGIAYTGITMEIPRLSYMHKLSLSLFPFYWQRGAFTIQSVIGKPKNDIFLTRRGIPARNYRNWANF